MMTINDYPKYLGIGYLLNGFFDPESYGLPQSSNWFIAMAIAYVLSELLVGPSVSCPAIPACPTQPPCPTPPPCPTLSCPIPEPCEPCPPCTTQMCPTPSPCPSPPPCPAPSCPPCDSGLGAMHSANQTIQINKSKFAALGDRMLDL